MRQITIGTVLAVCLLLLGACSSAEEQARDEFVDDCASQGAPEAMCDCAFGKLESRYGANNMSRMKEEGPPPDFVEAMVVAAEQCRDGDTSATLTLPSDNLASAEVVEEPEPPMPGQAEIEHVIGQQVTADQGQEYPDARIVRTGDLTRDGVPEAVVSFTIEVAESNTYRQYLAVIEGVRNPSVFDADIVPIGGPGEHLDSLSIEGGAIVLRGVTVGPTDPDCCPATPFSVEYLWHGGRLKRVI